MSTAHEEILAVAGLLQQFTVSLTGLLALVSPNEKEALESYIIDLGTRLTDQMTEIGEVEVKGLHSQIKVNLKKALHMALKEMETYG